MVVISPTMFDPDLFGGGDGHIFNIPSVPDWFEEWIGKAECLNILHRFLAQIMVDTEDLGFIEIGGENSIEGASRC